MSGKDNRKNLKIPEWLDDKLNEYCGRKRVKKGIVSEKLLDFAIDIDPLDPKWVDRVIGDKIESLKMEKGVSSEFKTEEIILKETLQWRRMAFQELLKSIPPDRKFEDLQRLIGDLNDPKFFDRIANMKSVMIDGEPRFLPMEKGLPLISGVDPSKIIECSTGYHIKDNKCDKCKTWFNCPIRLEERETYKKKVELEAMIRKVKEEYQRGYGGELDEELAIQIAEERLSQESKRP